MSNYTVATLDEIDEMDDGRCPMRPVRAHIGITSFGINALTAKRAGDRLINEHDEADDGAGGALPRADRARAVRAGRRALDAPAGTLVFAPPECAGRRSPRSRGRR